MTAYDDLIAYRFTPGKGYDKQSVETFRALALNQVDDLLNQITVLRDQMTEAGDNNTGGFADPIERELIDRFRKIDGRSRDQVIDLTRERSTESIGGFLPSGVSSSFDWATAAPAPMVPADVHDPVALAPETVSAEPWDPFGSKGAAPSSPIPPPPADEQPWDPFDETVDENESTIEFESQPTFELPTILPDSDEVSTPSAVGTSDWLSGLDLEAEETVELSPEAFEPAVETVSSFEMPPPAPAIAFAEPPSAELFRLPPLSVAPPSDTMPSFGNDELDQLFAQLDFGPPSGDVMANTVVAPIAVQPPPFAPGSNVVPFRVPVSVASAPARSDSEPVLPPPVRAWAGWVGN